MYIVVVAAAAAAETNVAPELKWSTYNKHLDTVDDPHLFNNQFETETSTDTMHSLAWKQKELRDSRFKIQGTRDSRTAIQAERRVKMPMSFIQFVVHPAFFHPYYLLLSNLHYKFGKIVTLSRAIGIITREFYTMKIGFKL